MVDRGVHRNRSLYIGALISVVLWGGNFVAVKFALVFVNPIFLTAIRFGIAALLLPFTGWATVIPFRVLALYSLVSCMGQYLLSTLSLSLGLSAGVAALVMQSQVFMSIGFGYWFCHEHLRTTTIIGSVLGFAGLALVLLTGRSNVTAVGFLVCLLAALSWSVAGLLIRHYKIQSILQLQSSAAALAFPVALISSILLEPRRYDVSRIVAEPALFTSTILYTTLLSFAAAQTLWGRAIEGFGLSAVSPLSMLIPLIGLFLAHLALGERYGLPLLASISLVVAGLGLHFAPLLRDCRMKTSNGVDGEFQTTLS